MMSGNLSMERASYTISLKHYTTRDGVRIACRVFEPRGDARAVLVFLHGAALNSQLYAPIGVRLSSIFRMRVVLVDMRGHGESDGRRGHVEYIGQLEDDIHDVLNALKRESPARPLFLGAHSAGSSVIVRYAGLKGAISPDGYVFVSALLVKNPVFTINSGQEKSVNNGAKDVVSKFHLMRLVLLDILNRLGFTAFNTLPIVHFQFPQNIGMKARREVESYSYNMFRQMDVQNYYCGFKNIDRPLLMIIGQADALVPPENLRIVFDQYVPSGIEKSFKVLAKCDHFSVIWGAGKEIGEWMMTRIGNPVDKVVVSDGDTP